MLFNILKKLEISAAHGQNDIKVTPFTNKEDGTIYDVWKVETGPSIYVLKKAKTHELSVYQHFFSTPTAGVPNFLGSVSHEGADYFLMSYTEGEDLCHCIRPALTKALDALISLQDQYWNNHDLKTVAYSYEASFESRIKRGQYLGDPSLEAAYGYFLDTYKRVPRTLCHDDLLPFNVLVGENQATLIDWEYGGILPYLSPLARLIAHGTEDHDALFYMTHEDKQYTIDYYYNRLIKGKDISYDTYRQDLNDFLLYEYCEWIMLGNKYGNTESDRYIEYRNKALKHIGTYRRN